MNKQVKLSTSTVNNENTTKVKKEKISVVSALVDIPFNEPDVKSFLPLPHVIVTLCFSDDSTVQRGFDYIQGCPLEKYVQMAIGIYNQYASSDSSK